MREQAEEITIAQIRECVPPEGIELLRAEAMRVKGRMLQQISFSDDLQMLVPPAADGRQAAGQAPDRDRFFSVKLSGIDSDRRAEQVFTAQLQEDCLMNGVLSIRVRTPRRNDSLLYTLKKSIRYAACSPWEKKIAQNLALKVPGLVLSSGKQENDLPQDVRMDGTGMSERRRGQRKRQEEMFSLCGMTVPSSEVGRTALWLFLASVAGEDTKILHAAAMRFHFETVEDLLGRYDSILSRTPSHVPDLFESARKLHRHFIIHVGGTNTGKTHDAMKMLAEASSGVYLCPLRMLAYEGRAVIRSYGVPCSFATGEEKEIDPKATHISETIGMLDFDHHYACAVIDECQLISGEDGSLYTNAILGVQADTVCVCCAYSGLEITKKLIGLCGDDFEVIGHHRSSELKFEEEPYRGPRKNDAYIVFSRLGAYEMAGWLQDAGMNPSIVYGKLPYEVKMNEARKFESGETDCLVATDAIAIGQNYNIERIVFRDIVKHINRKEVRLDSQTVKQVAGRAGRYGRFPVGYVNTFSAEDREEIRTKLEEEDVPSKTAPLELPEFFVGTDLPLSLIYRAWNCAEVGEPFVKADTTVELFICRLIEEKYATISREDEYNLASLPLDMKDRSQIVLLEGLLDCYRRKDHVTDEEYRQLLPSDLEIRNLMNYRPHLRDCEKLCRDLDLASSFFYKIRRQDLAEYAIHLKSPVTRKIAKIMGEKVPSWLPGEEIPEEVREAMRENVPAAREKREKEACHSGSLSQESGRAIHALGTAGTDDVRSFLEEDREGEMAGEEPEIPKFEDTSVWPVAYIFVSESGQTERNTGRYPYGDYSRISSRKLWQSFGNEADYIDYYCYKRKDRTPDYCRYESYIRYTVKLDPRFIVLDEGAWFLAERFLVVKSEYKRSGSPMRLDEGREKHSRSQGCRNHRR